MNLKQLSKETGFPVPILKLAKTKGCPGFTNKYGKEDGRKDVSVIKPWLEKHKDELYEEAADDLQEWKLRNERAEALIKEKKLEELNKKYLVKEDVMAFLRSIAGSQSALLKTRLVQELPPKLLGLSVTDIGVQMEKAVIEVCNKFQEGLDTWK